MRACRLKQLPGFQTLKDGIKFQQLSKLLEAFREVAKCTAKCSAGQTSHCNVVPIFLPFFVFFPTLQFPKNCI